MQAILTKYLPPTNTKGARIKALCNSGSVIINWDHRKGEYENHVSAAKALMTKLDWKRYELHSGSTDLGYAFILGNPI